MVAAFAPFEFFPAALLSLAVLTHLWVTARGARAAAWAGFLFGLGMFLGGVSWVFVSLHRFGAMPAPLAAFATLAFCAVLALYPALAGYAQFRLRCAPAVRAALVIPACWVLAEALRATLFTGFPWLALGTAAIDTPLAGYAPLGGVYGTTLVAAACAGLVWCVALGQARWAAAALALTYAIPVLMAAYVAEILAKITGAPTFWHIMGVLLAITALAYIALVFGAKRDNARA